MDRGNDFGRWRVLFHAFLRDQPGTLSAPALDQQFPFIPHEENTVLSIQVPAVLEFLRARRQQSAVVPVQVDGRLFAPRGKLIMNARRQRERLGVNCRRAGVHASRAPSSSAEKTGAML